VSVREITRAFQRLRDVLGFAGLAVMAVGIGGSAGGWDLDGVTPPRQAADRRSTDRVGSGVGGLSSRRTAR
jgi:hypothetical protein